MSDNDKSSAYVQRYIEFVMKMWQKYKRLGEVIDDHGEVTPARVNTAMALYPKAIMIIQAEYRRQKIAFRALEVQFKLWESKKLQEAKQVVISEYQSNKSIKPSVKEYEAQLRIANEEEWYDWSMRLIEAEEKISFFRQLRDDLNNIVDILRTLSTNMRNEMRHLNIDEDMTEEINPYTRPPADPPPQRIPM